MSPQRLPVRPSPRPGEPLTAYAARLADANGLTRSRVLLPWRQDIDVPSAEVSAIATLGGLDPVATSRLTMNRYPLVIRGHGPQRRHGWRLHHSVRWVCPSCTPTTGRTDLLWQTALMPVCLRCRCYLVDASSAPLVAVPAHPRVLELAQVLADLAESSIADHTRRNRLYRLRRRCQRLAATIDANHPVRDADLPDMNVTAARQWGAYPCPDPATVATLIVLSGRRLVPQKRTQPVHLQRRQAAEFTETDRDRLAWFLTRLGRNVVQDDLRPEHVPTLLPMPEGENGRGPGAWLSLTRAAAALHLLISRAADQDATPASAMVALGVPDIPSCALIDGIHTGSGLREQDSDLLFGALEVLLADGLVDYQRRRDTLRVVTRLPRDAIRRLPPTFTDDPAFGQLALAWIWTRFTHGPMRSSPWPTLPDRDVAAFDRRIDPETRLVLHETGQQLLAEADLTSIPATATTGAGITRRFG
ncbi:TniQ family protein [Serinicoccus marinus]|uniref:TniQ family protein n=1 Tax=Serinicoccus marinus TaxID=247333 RepID=UPI002490E709|nr:TniQ family protein [Serinicoccus marinus]